jgi:hypothetical protein
MRKVLLISAIVVSLVTLTAVMPSDSMARFGRWGVGYGGYSGYAGYGGCGLGYGSYVGYGAYPVYSGYRGYGAGYYGRYYRGRAWYRHKSYRTARHVAYRVNHHGRRR